MYGNFRTLKALSDDELRKLAPSIFAEEPEPGVSDRYGFIPTSEVVAAMRKEGLVPTYAAQCNVKTDSNELFAKHMLRFSRVADLEKLADVPKVVNGNAHHFFKQPPEIAQVTLVNAHDRSSTYQLDAAIWRMLCGNGLMVAGSAFESIHVRHGKQIVDEVLEGTYRIAEEMPRVFERVEEMKSVALAPAAQRAFAEMAAAIRWSDSAPIDPTKLLTSRRTEDETQTLWGTYNVVQENLMRGGIRGHATTGRRLTTRAIDSVNEDVRLNRALWLTADAMRDAAAARH